MKILALALISVGLVAGADKAAPAKVKDIICGMMVDPKTAEKATHNGKTYYFCSRDEKVAFEKEPAKYVKAAEKK